MADVFISYRNEDRAGAASIVRGLEQAGFTVWWDQGLIPAEHWRETIVSELKVAKCVLVLWSAVSADLTLGRWVHQEAEEAIATGKYIPAMIEDVLPPLGLRHVQCSELIDWRGDHTDPRWLQLLELVRAKTLGRDPHPEIMRWVPAINVRHLVHGRMAEMGLGLGSAFLLSQIGFLFGVSAALTIFGSLAVGYLAIDHLLRRRRGDLALLNTVRRLLTIRKVAILGNGVVWGVGLVFFVTPSFTNALTDEVLVQVVDEFEKPLANASAHVVDAEDVRHFKLDSSGTARIQFWTLTGGPLIVSATTGSAPSQQAKASFDRNAPPAKLVLRLSSGKQLFRVAHWTAEGMAIDAIANGVVPPSVMHIFPNVIFVLKNAVLEETQKFLRAFQPSVTVMSDGKKFSQTLDGKETIVEGLEAEVSNVARAWREHLEAEIEGRPDTNKKAREAQVLQNELNRLLSIKLGATRNPVAVSNTAVSSTPRFYLDGQGLLKPYYTFYAKELRLNEHSLKPDAPTEAWLRKEHTELFNWYSWSDAIATECLTCISMGLQFRLDSLGIQALLAVSEFTVFAGVHNPDLDPVAYLRYFADRNAPEGLVWGEVVTEDSCGGDQLNTQIYVSGPEPNLRLTVIENISGVSIPIASIQYSMIQTNLLMKYPSSVPPETKVMAEPIPGGVLRPGEAIIVPTRLSFKLDREVELQPVENYPDHHLQFELFDPRDGQTQTIRIPPRQIARTKKIRDEPARQEEFYFVGASIEGVNVLVNQIVFPLRADKNRSLGIWATDEWGSCPFLFVRRKGISEFQNLGTVITRAVGPNKEMTTSTPLGTNVAEIEIRELEREISFINAVKLVVRDRHGHTKRYLPTEKRLRAIDESRVVLKQGEVLTLDFDYVSDPSDVATIEVTGWYRPDWSPQKVAQSRFK